MSESSFADWTRLPLPLPREVASCFMGRPRIICLPAGMGLYRLHTGTLPNRLDQGTAAMPFRNPDGGMAAGSPWFFRRETKRAIDEEAYRTGQRWVTVARRRLAVPHHYSLCFDRLFEVNLRIGGFAYAGPASPQPVSPGPGTTKHLPGGFEQLWIPGMTPEQFRYLTYTSL